MAFDLLSCSIKSCIHRVVVQDCSNIHASRRYWNIIIEHKVFILLHTIANSYLLNVHRAMRQKISTKHFGRWPSKEFLPKLWSIQVCDVGIVTFATVCRLLPLRHSRFILIALNYMIACEIRLFSRLQSIIKFFPFTVVCHFVHIEKRAQNFSCSFWSANAAYRK